MQFWQVNKPPLKRVGYVLFLWGALASHTQAVPITIGNPGFDDSGSGVGGSGFDASGADVLVWRNAGTTPGGGAYTASGAPSAPNAATTAASKPGAFQLTNYVAQTGDVFKLTYYAKNGAGNTKASVRLLKTNSPFTGGGTGSSTQNDAYSATATMAYSTPTTTSTWTKYTLTYTATAADTGKIVGVAFDSATGGAPNYDSFALDVAHTFVHPGISHSQADLDRMKNNINIEPYKTAYAAFASTGYSQYNNTGQGPFASVSIGNHEFSLRNDAQVCYQNAIMWYVTGDTRYRDNAIQLMNAWANTLQSFDVNDHLTAGQVVKDFSNAGEIIRATGGGVWAAADIAKFKTMLTTYLLPPLLTPGNGYSGVNHMGTDGVLEAAGHGGLQIKGLLSMGIFCDRPDIYSFGISSYLHNNHNSYGLLEYIDVSGQNFESQRDTGHASGNIGTFAANAYMVWNQGQDLFSLYNNLLAKAFEVQAKFDLGWDVAPVVWVAADGPTHSRMSGDNRTAFDNLQSDLAYHIYHDIKGLNMPYTKISADFKFPNGTSDGSFYTVVSNSGTVPIKPLIGEPAAAGVRLYEDYLSGSYQTNFLPGTYNHAALLAGGMQSYGGPPSSIRIPIGWTVTLYDGDLSGSSIQVTGTLANQGIINLGDIGWNDRPYSMVVTGGGTYPIFNGTYKIVNRNSGQLLDLYGGVSLADGAPIVQYPDVSGLDEIWRVENMGHGQYKIQNLYSNKALEVPGALLTDGTATDQGTYIPQPNLATGGTATASSAGTEGAAQAFDGSSTTKWSAAGAGSTGWLQYALPNALAVDTYTVTSANDVPERDPSAWQFQGSSDGSTWATLDTQTGQVFASRFLTLSYAFTNTTAYKYYRLNVTANAGGSSYAIQLSELALYYSQSGGTRWTGGTATASSAGTEGAAQAFDGSSTTKWSAAGAGSTGWLQYALPTGVVVNAYTITSANDVPERDPSAWQFQGSNDGSTWTTLDTKIGQVFASRFLTLSYAFTNTTAYKYYRLNVTANAGGSSYSIQLSELALYYSQTGGIYQRWGFTSVPGATYGTFQKIINANSLKLLDISGGSMANNASAIQWPDTGGTNQQWTFQVP